MQHHIKAVVSACAAPIVTGLTWLRDRREALVHVCQEQDANAETCTAHLA